MYILNLAGDNRILSVGKAIEGRDYSGKVVVNTLPDKDVTDYYYKDGKYEYSPIERPEQETVVSRFDAVEAQVIYTAMMTDTLMGV